MVTFSNLSTGQVTTCAWTFGDGGISTLCGPVTYSYVAAGAYTVTLTVTGPGGSDTATKVNYVTVTDQHTVYLPLVVHRTSSLRAVRTLSSAPRRSR
jgi:PKD repeat protein